LNAAPPAVRPAGGTMVGGDRAAYGRAPGVSLPALGPETKPGCGSRLVEGAPAGGLDELEDMYERGFSDGLPVVPPTRERVDAMLGGRDPAASLGEIPPSQGDATLERIAACAVLAGCRPEYFPVVVPAAEAARNPVAN